MARINVVNVERRPVTCIVMLHAVEFVEDTVTTRNILARFTERIMVEEVGLLKTAFQGCESRNRLAFKSKVAPDSAYVEMDELTAICSLA
jgi:hypothetical protein